MQLRETFVNRGPTGLSDAELLALVLGTGTRGMNALSVATALLDAFGGLTGLRHAEPTELAAHHGMGVARAVRVSAAIRMGTRSLRGPDTTSPCTTPEHARDVLAPALAGLEDEELHGLFLDRRRRPLATRQLTRGSHAFTIVDPRQIYRSALKLGASAVILAHNHPSGDPTPSACDLDVTERVARAGKVLGVPLLDHLVIADRAFRSIAADGHLPQTSATGTLWTA